MSFEELRLHDYEAGRSGASRRSTGMASNIATNLLFAPAPLQAHDSRTYVRALADDEKTLGNDVVTFVVGKNPPEKFSVHESVIEARSKFVSRALKGEWKEEKERTIPLPDDEPLVFELYQEWLYSGFIYTRGAQVNPMNDHEYELLVKAYILGEKIIDTHFKDSVLDAMVAKLRSEQSFDTRLTKLAFENTPPASLLRRLFLDVYYYFGTASWLDMTDELLSNKFLVDFSRYQMQKRIGFDSFGKDGVFSVCAYHEHGLHPRWQSP